MNIRYVIDLSLNKTHRIIEMSPQKNTYLLKNKTPNHYKKLKIFRYFFSSYSNCHRIYGDFDDKENFN